MERTKTTREITNEYKVTRQTLNTWVQLGMLNKPKKDFRNWYIWTKDDEKKLAEIISQKTKNNNLKKNNNNTFKISNRRYLGAKNKLLGFIDEVISDKLPEINTVADIFAGTGVVSDLFAKKDKNVIVNDILYSNYISYLTWFSNEEVDLKKIESIIEILNNLNATNDNYVSINFGDKYFTMENARKIGAIREKIETFDINEREKAFLLTSLLYAMDKVANTVGHYDAYRKNMDSFEPIYLKMAEYRANKNNEIYCEDANNLVKKIKADLVYIDTPYNSRQYGDAYHLLENIIKWEKPRVEGVAGKAVDRSKTKSVYSTKQAPEAFDDLIQNIDAKYILVSYNNMAKKGNGRSNAKISNDEIIKILEKRGNVQVYEIPFAPFTTGKTSITDHKELLYLCEIQTEDKINKNSDKYIKSALNYTGGKHKILDQIIPYFPKNISSFYDLFAGGCNVGINVNAEEIYLNDINEDVISLYNTLKKHPINTLLKDIENIIIDYRLTNTKLNGYDYYNANSSEGLKKINEKHYIQLRNDYNKGKFKDDKKNIVFYILIVFGFNNQIRFNNKGKFNMPPGKRDFNLSMESKLISFKTAISKDKIYLKSQDYKEFIKKEFNHNDFIYADPPYLISTASYNENGGWNEQDELELYQFLDQINKKNVKFALSNVLEHKGKENILLKKWAEKYNVHNLNFNYNNSNYQTKNNGVTLEVLITNY